MAYAIIRTGGKQFRVSPGDVIRIPTLADKNEGDTVEFDEVLVAGDPEWRTEAERLKNGIPIADGNWEALCKAGERVGVAAPRELQL